jgi:gamma-glutamyl-gamma-aminobutyraldehyde dehydrogenase
VWLELGGKSPNIIMPDYPDLKRVAESSAAAIFSNAGAICSAGSRLLVHRDIKEEMLAHLIEASLRFQPGHPLDPATRVGAVIDENHLHYILSAIERGKQDATLLCGGKRTNQQSGGFYIEPTLFDCPDPGVYIAREEIFGPVLSVITFNTVDEALTIANDTEYGLAAAIWTKDMDFAYQMSRSLRAGTVWINNYDEMSDMNLPFGGYKQSGFGRDN